MNPAQQTIIAESYINHLNNTMKVLGNNYQESIARGKGVDLANLVVNMRDTLTNLKELLLLNSGINDPFKKAQEDMTQATQLMPPFFTPPVNTYPFYQQPHIRSHYMRPPDFTRPTAMQDRPSPFVGNDPMHPDNAHMRPDTLTTPYEFRLFQESVLRDHDSAKYMHMYKTGKTNPPGSFETFIIVNDHKVSKGTILIVMEEIAHLINKNNHVVFYDAHRKTLVPIHRLHEYILTPNFTPTDGSKQDHVTQAKEPRPSGTGRVTLDEMLSYVKTTEPQTFDVELEIFVPPGEDFVVFKNLGKTRDGGMQLGDLMELGLKVDINDSFIMNRHVAFAYATGINRTLDAYDPNEPRHGGIDYDKFLTGYIKSADEILKWIEHPFFTLHHYAQSNPTDAS